jgi:hypothetical protein
MMLLCSDLCAGMVDHGILAAQHLINQALPEQVVASDEQVQMLTALTNDEGLWQLLQGTSYEQAESCKFVLGEVVVEVCWGFAGSGDCLMPLPPMTVQFKPLACHAKPSTQGLVMLLAKKGVLAKIEQQKVIGNLLVACSKNPLCLLGLKLFLLLKDHRKDEAFVRYEMACLLARLSLTTLPGKVAKIPSITALLPKKLHSDLKTYVPDMLEVMDIVWVALTSNQQNPLDAMHTIQAIVTTNSESAALIAKSFESYAGGAFTTDAEQDLVSKGFKCLSRSDLAKTKKTAGLFKHVFAVEEHSSLAQQDLPREVQAALVNLEMHKVVSVSVGDEFWFVYKTTTLSAADTAKAFAAIIVNTFRRFVQERQQYFAANPQALVAHKEAEKAKRLQRLHKAAFLRSALGIKLTRGLIAKIDLLKQEDFVVPAAATTDDVGMLISLQKQADSYKAVGADVPEALLNAIKDLSVTVKPSTALLAKNAPIDVVMVIGRLAQIYVKASDILEQELARAAYANSQRINFIADKYEKILASNAFELEQLTARTYVVWLKEQADMLTCKAEQAKQLQDYRTLHAMGLLNCTQANNLFEMGKLELLVGHFFSCKTTVALIDLLCKEAGNVDLVKQAMVAGNDYWKGVPFDDAMNQLSLLAKRSPHLHNNLDVYRYIIDLYLPALRAPFDSIVVASQAVL